MGHLSGINLVGRKPGILLGDQSSTNRTTFANLLLQHKPSPQLEENATIRHFCKGEVYDHIVKVEQPTYSLMTKSGETVILFVRVCVVVGKGRPGFQFMLEGGMVSVIIFSKSMSGARAMRQ